MVIINKDKFIHETCKRHGLNPDDLTLVAVSHNYNMKIHIVEDNLFENQYYAIKYKKLPYYLVVGHRWANRINIGRLVVYTRYDNTTRGILFKTEIKPYSIKIFFRKLEKENNLQKLIRKI